MTRSKKIFAACAIVFVLLMTYVVYDISTRTTFPGSGSPAQDSAAAPSPLQYDSTTSDTVR